jgi:hypothetical protein
MAEKRKKKNTFCRYLIVLVVLIKAIRFQSFQFRMKKEHRKRKTNVQTNIKASGYIDTITSGFDGAIDDLLMQVSCNKEKNKQ